MKKILLFLGVFLLVTLFAEELMLKETPFLEVLKQIGKHKITLIEVGSDSCHSCQKMGKILYKIKQKHPEYPIYFVNVRKEREVAYRLKVQMIPTQIVVNSKGYEIYRHIGVLLEKEIERIFEK